MTTPNADNEPAGQRRAGEPRQDDATGDAPRTDDRAGGQPRYAAEPRVGDGRPGDPTFADVRAGDLGPDPADTRRDISQNLDASRYEYAETALGGADSVQKTSYVTGEGTEPEGAPRANVVARTSSGGGINVAAWVIGAVAALIAAIYMLGIFR